VGVVAGKLKEVVYVSWIETERGWGVRSDGCSLHLTKEDFKGFVEQYWSKMPDDVPDEYSRPAGGPEIAYVTQKLYKKIQESDKGIRLWKDEEGELVEKGDLVYK
jgi:hypothetical protein